MIKTISTDKAPAAIGPYSQAKVVGNFVFTSGQIAINPANGEIEAVTRASGAQIMLAKLVLAGSANLVCITIVLCLEMSIQSDCGELGQMVLYCLVPYLVCMTGMLRLVRLQRKESIWTCAVIMLGSCVCWAISSRVIPWLYATSAASFWLIAFVVFGIFFVKEVLFIVEMRKEGKIYGIIA